MYILQLLAFGLQLGAVYALLALGYTMVYGIIRLINFAHGDFLMVGTYIVYFFVLAAFGAAKSDIMNLGMIVIIALVSAIAVGLLGVFINRVAYKPLRNQPRLSALITAIGVSLCLENIPRVIPWIGPVAKPFPALFELKIYEIGSLSLTSIQIITFASAIILMIALQLFISKTMVGKKMRAVSLDQEAASLMGIDVNSVISVTFFIGAALAAVSGIFYASTYPVINLMMGATLGTKAFIAAVFGGIGDVRGAMLGGFLLGIIEVMATSIDSSFGSGAAFILLIVVLLVKPAGLMGSTVTEKV